MSDLSERIRKLAEFAPCKISKINNQYKHGRRAENARLLPLIEALVSVAESLDGICEYCACSDNETKDNVTGGREALARLERLVGGE